MRDHVSGEHVAHQGAAHRLGGQRVIDGAAKHIVPQRVLAHRLAGQHVAHVAGDPTRGREHFVRRAGAAAAGIKTLQGEVEESLVLAVVDLRNPDGAAERSAAIQLAIAAFRRVIEVAEERVGVQILVAQLEERAPVDLVLARFHHKVEEAAGGPAVFGAHAGGLYLEFLYGFGRRALLIGVSGTVAGGCRAIHQDFLGELRGPQDFGAGSAARDSRRQLDCEILHVAPAASEVEGQFVDDAVLQHHAHHGTVGLQGRRLARHRDRIFGRAHGQRGVHADGFRHGDHNVGSHQGLQAVGFKGHFIRSGRQVYRIVIARARGGGLVLDVGGQVADRNFGSRHYGAGRIGDGAGDGAAIQLSETGRGEQRGSYDEGWRVERSSWFHSSTGFHLWVTPV